MLTGSFSLFRLPGLVTNPNDVLEVVVEPVLLVSCTNIVTLVAEVIPDLPGHTYEWVQTGGPAVVWLEPQNQLMVTFQKPAAPGDLFFRFYVDRYTPFAVTRDMVVSNVARDDMVYATAAVTPSFAKKSLTSGLSTGITNLNLSPATQSPGIIYQNSSNIILTWTNPTPAAPVTYTKTEIYIKNGASLTYLDTVLSPGSSYQNLAIGQPNYSDTYLFRSYWALYGLSEYGGYVDTIETWSGNFITLSTVENFDKYSTTIQTPSGTSIFQTQIVELTSLDNVDTLGNYQTIVSSNSSADIFQTQFSTLVTIPESLSDTPNYAINIQTISNLSIFQTQISGGVINV